jgi:hypothetical protein
MEKIFFFGRIPYVAAAAAVAAAVVVVVVVVVLSYQCAAQCVYCGLDFKFLLYFVVNSFIL